MLQSIAIVLVLVSLPAMAEVYRYTDARGNLVFTSQPPEGAAAESVELAPINTISPEVTAQPKKSPVEAATQNIYSTLELTDIPDQEALRANNGTFTVRAKLVPRLSSGHRLQLELDGQAYGAPTNVPILQLVNLDRGTHSLVLVVLSGKAVVQKSAPVVFTVQRVALGARLFVPDF